MDFMASVPYWGILIIVLVNALLVSRMSIEIEKDIEYGLSWAWVGLFWAIFFRIEGLRDIHEVIPAFVLSLIVYLVISWMTRNRRPEKAHLDKLFRKREAQLV